MLQISINRPFLYKTVVSAPIYNGLHNSNEGIQPFIHVLIRPFNMENKQTRQEPKQDNNGRRKKLGVRLTMDGPQTEYVPVMRQSEPKTMAETHTSSHHELQKWLNFNFVL